MQTYAFLATTLENKNKILKLSHNTHPWLYGAKSSVVRVLGPTYTKTKQKHDYILLKN